MNTKEEIVDVFEGHPSADLPPPALFTQTGTTGQMDACGSHWPEANFDPGLMAKISLQASRMFGFATARVPFCITVEADSLGAEVTRGGSDSQPSVVGSRYQSEFGVEIPPEGLVCVDDFVEKGRCSVVIEAAERITSENPDIFLTAGMNDPVAIAVQMVGAENAIFSSVVDPDALKAWVDAMIPYCRAYGNRLSEATDNVLVIASAFQDLWDPSMYRTMVRPGLEMLVGALGGSYSTAHSCGNTLEVADDLASIGFDALSLEASDSPKEYLERVGGKCLMTGCVNPVKTLLRGSMQDVRDAAMKSAELGFDLVTPECGVPPHTPNDNLLALSGYRTK